MEKYESAEDVADHLAELEQQQKVAKRKSQQLKHGDILGSTRVKGFRDAFCPLCQIYVPVLFLRFDDKLGYQTIGYACSACEKPLLAITRNKDNGQVMRRFVQPGAKFA